MLPVGAEELVRRGHKVLIETGAGLGSGLSDHEYEEAGATIVPDAKSVFAGPLMTLPSLSKRDPWQGQSQVFSAAFHCTMQPRWPHTAEHSCRAPCSSL